MCNEKIIFDIQMFADPTPVNTTGSSGLTPEMKTYYDQQLLDNAEPELVFARFAQKRNIPQGKGRVIEFRRFSALDKNTTALTEGVTPEGKNLEVTAITARIEQYGDYVTTSDMLDLVAIDPIITEANQLLGSQAGRTMDTLVRDEVAAGTNVMWVGGKTSRKTLTANDKLTVDAVRKAANILRRNNAPKIDGHYVAIVHPDVATDLRSDPAWIDAVKYGDPQREYDGEIGKLEGVVFYETTEAPIWAGSEDEPTGLAVYGCMFLGKNAYGTVALDGASLRMIMKAIGSGGTSDPLDQRATIGWKAATVTKRLSEEFMVRVECCSSMSAEATAN